MEKSKNTSIRATNAAALSQWAWVSRSEMKNIYTEKKKTQRTKQNPRKMIEIRNSFSWVLSFFLCFLPTQSPLGCVFVCPFCAWLPLDAGERICTRGIGWKITPKYYALDSWYINAYNQTHIFARLSPMMASRAYRVRTPWVSSMRITRIVQHWAPAASRLLAQHCLHTPLRSVHSHALHESIEYLQHAKCHLFVEYILFSTIIFVIISNNSRLCRFIYICELKWKRVV